VLVNISLSDLYVESINQLLHLLIMIGLGGFSSSGYVYSPLSKSEQGLLAGGRRTRTLSPGHEP